MEGELQVHPLSPPCHQFVEHVMAVLVLMVRHHLGQGALKRLSFQHKAPADMSWHEKTFQCPIEFNADKNIGYMPLEFLDIRLDGRLKILQPLLKTYLDRKVIKNALFNTSIAHTAVSYTHLTLPTTPYV